VSSLGVRYWLVLVIAACGSKQSAPPVITAAAPPASAATATCSDVGVILRGEVSSDDEAAGRARELTIEKSCRDDKWPQSTIDCVASTPHPQDCVSKLDDKRVAAHEERLRKWAEQFGGDDTAAGAHMQLQTASCDDLLAEVSKFPPALDGKAVERDWQVKARRDFLVEECEHTWSERMKDCIEGAAGGSAEIEGCFVAELSPDERDEATKALTELDALAAKIAAAKKKPASIACKQVVAKHYADALWKQKLDGYKAADRKKMIAASRTVMTNACTADAWSETMRACIVLRGGDVCFDAKNKRKWGYPATGAVTSVGIAECDEYAAAVAKLTACNMLPQAARDSIVRSQQQMLAEIARVPADERAKMGSSCKAGMEAIAMSLSSAGC
jgi:hypothetical protein